MTEVARCLHIALGSMKSYTIGEFIGEEQIVGILAKEREDSKGLLVTLIFDNGQRREIIHSGSYIMMIDD